MRCLYTPRRLACAKGTRTCNPSSHKSPRASAFSAITNHSKHSCSLVCGKSCRTFVNVTPCSVTRVTFVFGQYFSTILSLRCVTSFWTDQDNMKFPHFPSRKKIERLNRQDEKIFAEASELAQLRLEQSIADLRMAVPTMNDTLGPHGTRPLKKFTNLF